MKSLLLYILLTLTITLEAALISDDFPNTPASALEIGFTSDINGTLETINDEDWFWFTLEQDDGVVINLSQADEFVFQYLGLYSAYFYTESYTDISGVTTVTASELKVNSLIQNINYSGSEKSIVTMNLEKGTYLIKLKKNDETIVSYHFNIRINGEPEPEIILDATTMQYCKEHPLECGMTNDTFAYTEADINKSITDTKTLCKENPTLCGIEEVKAVTAEDINTLESGWHLIGTSQAITDLSVFDAAKVVWAWSNGWKLYSPVQSIQETIASSLSYTSLDQIDAQKGFWILKD